MAYFMYYKKTNDFEKYAFLKIPPDVKWTCGLMFNFHVSLGKTLLKRNLQILVPVTLDIMYN